MGAAFGERHLSRPMVIRLVSYVRIPRDTHRRKITRRAVFARDDWTCQYCGSRSNLTVDHVVPRSKGGASSWDNIVASCAPCNRRKGSSLCASRACGSPPAARAEPERLHPGRHPDDPRRLAGLPGGLTDRPRGCPETAGADRVTAEGCLRLSHIGRVKTSGQSGLAQRIVATPLFRDRPRPVQIVSGGVVPAVLGGAAGSSSESPPPPTGRWPGLARQHRRRL